MARLRTGDVAGADGLRERVHGFLETGVYSHVLFQRHLARLVGRMHDFNNALLRFGGQGCLAEIAGWRSDDQLERAIVQSSHEGQIIGAFDDDAGHDRAPDGRPLFAISSR